MVFMNAFLFQWTVLHLVSHHSFTPSSCLHFLYHETHWQVFSSFFLLHISFTFLEYFFSGTKSISFCLSKHSSLVVVFVLSFSVVTEGYMNRLCGNCIFDRTNQADILPWTRAAAALHLHKSTVSVQIKTLTPNWESLTCMAVAISVNLVFTTHTIRWLFLSPFGACVHTVLSRLAMEETKPLTLQVSQSRFNN